MEREFIDRKHMILMFFNYRDGANQDSGFCLKEVRNKRFPVQIKVVYYRKTLEVLSFLAKLICQYVYYPMAFVVQLFTNVL